MNTLMAPLNYVGQKVDAATDALAYEAGRSGFMDPTMAKGALNVATIFGPQIVAGITSSLAQLSNALRIGQSFEGIAGTSMTGWTRHGLNQSISRDGGLGVSPQAILDALRNPVDIQVTSRGTEYIGANARVVLNADGRMIMTNSTSTAGTRTGAQTSTVVTAKGGQ